jgi:hypothetical protein
MWAAQQSLLHWSHAEQLALYEAAYPVNRHQACALLRELQDLAAETPLPSDLIEGWYDPLTAERLRRVGLLTLADLRQRIQRRALVRRPPPCRCRRSC